MSRRVLQAIIPGYLVLCLTLGGSAQGVLGNLILQLLALAILVSAVVPRRERSSDTDGRILPGLIVAAILLLGLQLIPLPPAVWMALPGRAPVASAYELIGQAAPWLPWSLTPYQTVGAALALLPPVAVLLGMIWLRAYRASYVALAVVAVTIAGVVLGAVQAATGNGYLYRFTSIGQAAGFFANANYMGTLFLAAIPFLAGLVSRGRRSADKRRRTGIGAAAIATFCLFMVGLALNGSSAAMLLSLPVLLASAALLVRQDGKAPVFLVGSGLFAAAAGCLAIATMPPLSSDSHVSVSTRKEIYARSLHVAGDMFPAGGGLGSFPRLYASHEGQTEVDRVFVNHAHNDYLELLIETGLPGLVLLLVFLVWWVIRSVRIWRSPLSSNLAKSATIASAAILAHSAVDFPIRTAAIAAVFAASVGLMAEPLRHRARKGHEAEGRAVRHLSLE